MAKEGDEDEMKEALESATITGASAEQTGPAAEALAAAKAKYAHLKIDTGPIIEEGAKSEMEDAVYLEVDGYSITPKTFQSRTFFSDEEPSGDEEKESIVGLSSRDARAAEGGPIHPPRGLTYVDEFAFANNTVMRFGINSKISTLIDIIEQEKISLLNLDGPESTVKSKGYKPDEARKIKLANIEQELLGRAIEHLLSSEETKTVVVDILARQNGGPRNGDVKIKNGEIETHSVVLYKNPTRDFTDEDPATQKQIISVIDPSNFLFSSHLSNYQSRVPGVVLETFHKSIQIYKPLTETGPSFNQSRDCIDLAVKIAFGLNASKTYYDFTDPTNSVTNCPVIQHISNQVKIDEYILVQELPTRGKQTSDLKLVNMFYQTQSAVAKNLNTLDSVEESTTSGDIRSVCAEIISSTPDPLPVIRGLIMQNDACITNIAKYIESIRAEHSQLIGEVFVFES